ncbi:MAG: hypothetical protein RLY31_2 [Bacteroidota bacterium]
MKKTALPSVLLAIGALLLPACHKKQAREIRIDLHLDAPLSKPDAPLLPREITQLLQPLECPAGPNALVLLTVYRHDFDPPRTETVNVAANGINALRQSLNMMAFEHHLAEYERNASSFPNQPILSTPSPKDRPGAGLEGAGTLQQEGFTFICCEPGNQSSSASYRIVGNFDELRTQLQDSLCAAAGTYYNILYRPVAANRPDLPTIGTQGAVPSSELEAFFNKIGDKEVDPEKRLVQLRQHLDLFAPNAYVKEIGEAGTISEPVPLLEYLEKIALYRSLENIYVIEALKNDQGQYWEIRLKEHHSHKGI